MVPLATRVQTVLTEAWRRLPPKKRLMAIERIGLEDLGAHHGSFAPDTGMLTLSTRLFTGATPQEIPLIDIAGDEPPRREPYTSRALHTTLHEMLHAIGCATGLDTCAPWLALSSWVEAADDPPGTERYCETRPGWEPGPSPWRHRSNCWFTRAYASRDPYEDFADAATYIALGWTAPFATHPNGRAKLAFLQREVWDETGVLAVQAARVRWQARLAAGGILG